MTSIKAGVITDILNMILKVSDDLYAWLDESDAKDIRVDKVEKVEDDEAKQAFAFKVTFLQNSDGTKSSPYKYKISLILPKYTDLYTSKYKKMPDIDDLQKFYADVACDVYVEPLTENTGKTAYRKDVKGKDFWKVSREMFLELMDEDTKQAFGIKGSKRMKVTLQRIVSAKETAINLTAITADYALSEAYSDLDGLLTSDEFTDNITEEPVTLEIIDTGDDYDIKPAELALSEAASYGISQLICAAIQFQMDIQILRWYSAYNNELFGITGNLWWEANNWTDKLGLWYIEMTDSVFQVPQGCPAKPIELDDSSDIDPAYEIGLALANSITVFLERLEQVYIDLPHDMQGELNYLIRSLKETKDMQLRRVM